MADNFNNKIKRLELENFTCFGKVAMDFSPGINVFIGENGTGKTHLLKVLLMATNPNLINTAKQQPELEGKEFLKYYYPSSVNPMDIIRKTTPISEKSTVDFNAFNSKFKLQFARQRYTDYNNIVPEIKHYGIFFPPIEISTLYKALRSIRSLQKNDEWIFEMDIDPTYFYLVDLLSKHENLNGAKLDDAKLLAGEFYRALGTEAVPIEYDDFIYYTDEKPNVKLVLEATGIKKLAQIFHLIMNGSLTKDTILFWDEPEANLNPKYILIVAKFLQTLANAGCQIFVATHDYLLPYELSLSKEYADVAEGKVPDMKFFALYKGENGTEVEEGETMPDLKHDAIMEGAGRHNDREDILFRKSLNREK